MSMVACKSYELIQSVKLLCQDVYHNIIRPIRLTFYLSKSEMQTNINRLPFMQQVGGATFTIKTLLPAAVAIIRVI